MPGKRQPTAVVEANGRKHLTAAEKDERLDREVHVPPPDAAVPPKWLPKRLHGEYREIGEILRAAGLYAELDRDVLGQYFLSGRTRKPVRLSGRGMRSWPGSGPASRAPTSNRPGVARRPWASPLPPGVGSWCLRLSRMLPGPRPGMRRTSLPANSGSGRQRRWRKRSRLCR